MPSRTSKLPGSSLAFQPSSVLPSNMLIHSPGLSESPANANPACSSPLATIADTARVLSRYVDAIVIRILNHEALIELAKHATVPVINGLTRLSHPCQVMADVMTFEEHKGKINGHTVAWTGDANNVLSSWMHAAISSA